MLKSLIRQPAKRKDIKEIDKWDLSALFASGDVWQKAFDKAKKDIAKISKMSTKFSTKEDILKCLNFYFSLKQDLEEISSYAQLKLSEDMTNPQSNVRMNSATDLGSLFQEGTIFIHLLLAKKSDKFLKSILDDKKFSDYAFFIKKIIREKKHLLSDAEETILAKLNNTREFSYNIFRKMNDADFKFPDIVKDGKKIQVSQSNFGILLQDQDREVRKQTMQSMFKPYQEFRESLSQNLFQHIKNETTFAKIRKYKSAPDSFAFADDFKPAVYENLFKVAHENTHLLQRYCRLKKQALGYDKLYWHDLYAPLSQDVKDNISYDKAVEMILKSLDFLGSDYVQIAKGALTSDRWVDKYPNTAKVSGAYSMHAYSTPPYILMNFNGSLNSVSTLAHELGHSMHTYLAASNNTYSNYHYPIFLAEIASTFNEEALSKYLLENSDKKTRFYVLTSQLEGIRTTFFRQAMFAELEHKLYQLVSKGEMITADFLEKEHYTLNKKYYGKSVEMDRILGFEWSKMPHLFYNFYVYKYATSIALSSYFFESVSGGGKKELDDYLGLLKSGGSDFPANLLKKNGLDIYSPNYLWKFMKKFELLLDELEEEIKKNEEK